ncbi:MAG: DUF1688 family protein [Rubrivivax sp.]|nr:DUF1688 family protein [Rubrivivax sp.]
MSETPLEGVPPSPHPLARLAHPGTVRARCAAITRSVANNVSTHFTLDRSQLPAAAERVAALTLRRYPDLNIPCHSRWRHFEAGDVDRKAEFDALLAGRSVAEMARARFDLTVLSVLLGAGAGGRWSYAERHEVAAAALPVQRHASDELLALLDRAAKGPAAAAAGIPNDGRDDSPHDTATTGPAPAPAAAPARAQSGADAGGVYARSEGLAVASLRAFVAGVFSASKSDPLRADATTLKLVDAAVLRGVFQVAPANPMVGLEGRAGLVSRLGDVLAAEAARSGLQARPGLLYDQLTAGGTRTEVSAAEVLGAVLRVLSPIFTSGSRVQGLPAGDAWPHRWAGAAVGGNTIDTTTDGWVPLHKLGQWLSYSLVEPLQWAGVQVTGIDALTGLPEYRNGGLLIDCGVIVPRDARDLARTWKPGDEFIVEWRALTVTLLDELATLVRARLGKTAAELPLACILEGGTWAAGRAIAAELRSDGAPPLTIDSDGTVF